MINQNNYFHIFARNTRKKSFDINSGNHSLFEKSPIIFCVHDKDGESHFTMYCFDDNDPVKYAPMYYLEKWVGSFLLPDYEYIGKYKYSNNKLEFIEIDAKVNQKWIILTKFNL
jgi:hypothetical protein